VATTNAEHNNPALGVYRLDELIHGNQQGKNIQKTLPVLTSWFLKQL
jgi:hypothetical protein